ncbi:MAG: hypothetical protein J0I92_14430, partial [Phyllobacterium sp.]|nr:hypothetical protein [Phyllobacterium sp.]
MALDSDTMNELVNTVGRFVRERLRPLEEQVADNDAIPVEIRQGLAVFGMVSVVAAADSPASLMAQYAQQAGVSGS